MTPLEMIDEWRKGCSCAPAGHPEQCHECTAALVDALESVLTKQRELLQRVAAETWRFAAQGAADSYNDQISVEIPEGVADLILQNVLIGETSAHESTIHLTQPSICITVAPASYPQSNKEQ